MTAKFIRRLCPIFISVLPAVALAADWQVLLRGRVRTVEWDRASVVVTDAGTRTASARVVYSAVEATRLGYSAVQALDRFDCQGRTITTLRRTFFDGARRALREERFDPPEPLTVEPASADEALWRAVCQHTTSSLKDVAEAAKRAAEATRQTP